MQSPESTAIVEMPAAEVAPMGRRSPLTTPRIYVGYVNTDDEFAHEFLTHLTILETAQIIEKPLHDNCIPVGSDCNEARKRLIDQADIVILLLSANYINIREDIIINYKSYGALLIPIIVRTCSSLVEHVDCAIAVSGEIKDRAAISFSKAFYRAVACGVDIKASFTVAKHEAALVQPNVRLLLLTRNFASLNNLRIYHVD